ncbi:unnamed protein product [Microthlaspi erraticum]|uniref:RNase H type-1 domain-containing protein n=1 Tax=Microthlaspi erraticum TaxID=1685480 RepID=A0A6D2I5B3_9BRAS|nr:unnamed protein product [Microthlaspi erraticum]CAA7053240.1 unnamed protein product [Microthlaspi erraticum]
MQQEPTSDINWNAEIWFRKIPPKLQMFLWKLALGSSLQARGLYTGSDVVTGARNHLLFENRSFKPSEIITKACADAREWQQDQNSKPTTTTGKPRYVPSHTDPEAIVLYTDAAWNQDNKCAGTRWIAKDKRNQIIGQGGRGEAFVLSPLAAEMIAVSEALHQAEISGWNSIRLRSDSKTLIRAMQSGEQITEIFGILHDIFILSKVFVSISFNFTPRSDNFIADALAKKCLQDIISLYL